MSRTQKDFVRNHFGLFLGGDDLLQLYGEFWSASDFAPACTTFVQGYLPPVPRSAEEHRLLKKITSVYATQLNK